MGYDRSVGRKAAMGLLERAMPLPPPPRSREDLDEPALTVDHALRVAGARVVLADDKLLAADFPGLTGTVEDWLLLHAALISVTQAGQSLANTPIRTLGEPVPVYRLPRGGRAFFVPAAEGLLALKGVGVMPGVMPIPNVLAHGNGLFGLHEALKEILSQRLVEAILDHAGQSLPTLPVYAVLDLGFDICGAEGERWPAAALVRRAHRRPRGGWDLPRYRSREQALCLETELLLRRYGVTSVMVGTTYTLIRDPEGRLSMYYYDIRGQMQRGACPEPAARTLWETYARPGDPTEWRIVFEGINVQITRVEPPDDPELIDFGSYQVRESFESPLLSMVLDRESNWGGVIPPDSPHFVRPDPRLALPVRYWQPGEPGQAGEEQPEGLCPVDRVCMDLARGFREGRLSGADVQTVIERFVANVTAHWPSGAQAGRSVTIQEVWP